VELPQREVAARLDLSLSALEARLHRHGSGVRCVVVSVWWASFCPNQGGAPISICSALPAKSATASSTPKATTSIARGWFGWMACSPSGQRGSARCRR
jgi:hypothetical protein